MANFSFIQKSPQRALLLALSAISAGMLGVALIAQYGFGLYPCELCMLQRYPYVAIVALGIFGAIVAKTPHHLRIMVWLCALLLLADAGIAAYHAGVETGLFPGPAACTSSDKPGETLEEMRAAIMNAQLVPCDQPMAHVLGISMAGWNAIAASLLFIGTIIIVRKQKS